MGRRVAAETVVNNDITSDEPNGESSSEPRALTSAQRLAASKASIAEVAPDPYGREAKHFTETRVSSRDVRFKLLPLNFGLCIQGCSLLRRFNLQVRIVLEGVDKYSNLIGSVYYPDGESAKDLGLELVENVCYKHYCTYYVIDSDYKNFFCACVCAY